MVVVVAVTSVNVLIDVVVMIVVAIVVATIAEMMDATMVDVTVA